MPLCYASCICCNATVASSCLRSSLDLCLVPFLWSSMFLWYSMAGVQQQREKIARAPCQPLDPRGGGGL